MWGEQQRKETFLVFAFLVFAFTLTSITQYRMDILNQLFSAEAATDASKRVKQSDDAMKLAIESGLCSTALARNHTHSSRTNRPWALKL
jgi:hypothetical protein